VTPKLFTLAEANGLLPTLEPLMRRLQAKREELREHQQRLEEFRARAIRDGGVLPGSELAQAKGESVRLLAEIQEGIQFWHGLQEGFAGRKPLSEDPLD